MKRYGEIAIAILEEIVNITSRGVAFTEATLTVGPTRFLYSSLEKRFAEVMRENADIKERNQQRKKLFQTMWRLKKEGIVTRDNSGIHALTDRGKRILDREREFALRKLPAASLYRGKVTNGTTVIIFDIPEAQREKRKWFREVIMALGCSMVQKSVWMGNVEIPQELIQDLDSLSLLAYIKFFTAVGRGTLAES